MAKESGLTTEEVIEGVATGELVAEASTSGTERVEVVGVEPSKKNHID